MSRTDFEFTNSKGVKLLGSSWIVDAPKSNLVILTGMLEHSFRYDEFALKMNEEGISVYCLDYFGQGRNISKKEDYTVVPKDAFNLMLLSTKELIEELKKHANTSLFGHSMGSFLVQRFLEMYPHSADKFVICGTCSKPSLVVSLGFVLSKILVHKSNESKPSKFLNNLVLGDNTKGIKDAKTPCDWLSHNEENIQKYMDDEYCGGIASGCFYKEFLRGMKEIWKSKNLKRISKDEKILIISGAEDPVGACGKTVLALAKKYNKLELTNFDVILYKGMRHEILNEKENQQVLTDLKTFLN